MRKWTKDEVRRVQQEYSELQSAIDSLFDVAVEVINDYNKRYPNEEFDVIDSGNEFGVGQIPNLTIYYNRRSFEFEPRAEHLDPDSHGILGSLRADIVATIEALRKDDRFNRKKQLEEKIKLAESAIKGHVQGLAATEQRLAEFKALLADLKEPE